MTEQQQARLVELKDVFKSVKAEYDTFIENNSVPIEEPAKAPIYSSYFGEVGPPNFGREMRLTTENYLEFRNLTSRLQSAQIDLSNFMITIK